MRTGAYKTRLSTNVDNGLLDCGQIRCEAEKCFPGEVVHSTYSKRRNYGIEIVPMPQERSCNAREGIKAAMGPSRAKTSCSQEQTKWRADSRLQSNHLWIILWATGERAVLDDALKFV